MTAPQGTPKELTHTESARRPLDNKINEGREKPTRTDLLTRDEETALIVKAQAGDRDAMEELLARNRGLIWQMAAKFADPVNFPIEDAIQEGSLGLVRAVQKFDVNRGLKLSTYAMHWLRQHLGRARETTEDLIRLPIHIKNAQGKVRRSYARLTSTMGREPTTEEVAEKAGMTVEQVHALADHPNGWVSLDTKVHNNGGGVGNDTYLVDLIANPTPGPGSDETLAEFDLKQFAQGALELVDDKTRDLLRRRFGFPPYYATQSFDEIGAAYGVTRQAIEPKVKTAIRRLRVALGMSDEEKQSRIAQLARDRAIVAAVKRGDELKTVALQYAVQVRTVRKIAKQTK